jgi:glucokinase
MIIAIDIGGTKTLVALCEKNGQVIKQERFETPKDYNDFTKELATALQKMPLNDVTITSVAAPGKIDRTNGVVVAFGNLPWKNTPLRDDIQAITGTTVLIENDANLAGLSEAHRISPIPHTALYITISTGIGTGLITDGYLDPDFLDSEGGNMLFEHDGKLEAWEKFSSGKAIVAKYGKKASELDDPKAWKDISRWFAIGIVGLTAILEPDVIIIGGGVGTHFSKYEPFLKQHINDLTPPLVDKPTIVAAGEAEEAVVYGCVILANQYNEQHS